jgi:hypothetical protein
VQLVYRAAGCEVEVGGERAGTFVLNGESAEDRVGCAGRKREFGVGKRRDAGLNAEPVEQRLNRVAEVGFVRLVGQEALELLCDLPGPIAGQEVAGRARHGWGRTHAARG